MSGIEVVQSKAFPGTFNVIEYRKTTHIARPVPEDEAREAVVAAARNWNALPWNDDRRIEASRLFMDALDRLDALTKGDA